MKKYLIIALFLVAGGLELAAQVYEPVEYDFRGRINVKMDKKLSKGLHFSVSGQFGMKDNFSSADRINAFAGLSYKPCPYFKLAAGYTLMNIHSYSSKADSWSWKIRHRANLDLIGMYSAGNFRFSLRERLQYTYKAGEMNEYQSPRHELMLRSRLKTAYQFQARPVQAYVAVELTNTLNAVRFVSFTHNAVPGDNIRYDDIYLNRVRTQPGMEWKLNRHNSLDFYLLADYLLQKSYDADSQGELNQSNGLWGIHYGKEWDFTIGIGYKYSF